MPVETPLLQLQPSHLIIVGKYLDNYEARHWRVSLVLTFANGKFWPVIPLAGPAEHGNRRLGERQVSER